MRNQLHILVGLISLSLFGYSYVYSQCANGNNQGPYVFSCNSENVIFPMNQGDYALFPVISGIGYNFNTSGTVYNTQIWGSVNGAGGATSFLQDNNNIAGNNESIDWVATYTGTIGVAANFNDCNSWNGTSANLRYRQLTTISNTTSSADMCTGTSRPLTYSLSGNNSNPTPSWSISAGGGSISGSTYSAGSYSGSVTITATLGVCSSNVTFNVIPNNTISLQSPIGSNNQTVCVNSAISNISYTTTGATGASFTNLPPGVNGSFSGGLITISGTPLTTSGSPFSYTVQLTGGCGNVSATGIIAVSPSNSISLSSPVGSDNQTLCVNGAFSNITYNTTGAVGATVTGLPSGITSNFSSNTVIISGSPTQSGTFPYTVSLNGGCGNLNANGIITVSPIHSLTLNSALGTDNQNVCVNSNITSVVYSIGGGATGAFISGGAFPPGVTGNLSGSNFIISGTPNATGVYSVNLTTTGNSCLIATTTVTITVNAYPVVSLNNLAPSICNGDNTNIDLISNIPGTVWDWTVVGTGTTAGQSNQTGSPATSISQLITGSGTVTYSVSGNSNGCISNAGSSSVTVSPSPNGLLNGTTTICEGDNTTLTFVSTSGTGPFDFTYNPGNILVTGVNSGYTFSVSPTSSTTYSLAGLSDANSCSRSIGFGGSAVVSVNPLPLGSLTGATTICSGTSTDLTFVATAGTSPFDVVYTDGNSNFTLNGILDGATFSVSPTNTTSYSIVSINDANCTNPSVNNLPQTISVNPLPQGVISGTQPICIGQSTNITFNFTSGTGPFDIVYSDGTNSYNLSGVTNGQTLSVSPITNTTYTLVSIIDANLCSRSTALTNGGAIITVNPLPSVTLIGLNPSYCISSPIESLTGFPSGGTIAGTGITGSDFDPSSAGVGGPYNITYTYTDGNGCTNSTSESTTVFDLPIVSFTGLNGPYCASQTTPVPLSGNPVGGTFSGSGISGNDFFPSTAQVGSNAITYSFTDGNGCTNTSVQTETVIGIQVVSFSGLASSYCEDDATASNLIGNPIGGVFSGNGISGNLFTPSSAGVGSHPITYTYIDGNGCQGTSLQTAIVNALPIVNVSSSNNSYCISTPSIQFTGFPLGGTYSSLPVPGAMSGSTFDPSIGGLGNHTISYSFTDLNGCSNTGSTTITINDLPVVSFSINSDYCESSGAVSLSGSPVGGTFTGTGISGGSFYPSIAGVGGPYTITYSYTDGAGCSNSTSQTTSVSASPVITLLPYPPTCSDAAPFALSGGSPAGGTYSGPGVSGNNFDPSIAGPGTHIITYTYSNPGCSPGSASTNLVVSPAPTATISYATPFCTGTTAAQNPTLTGTSGGSYSSTAGLTLDANTGAIIPSSSTPGTYTVTYTVAAAGGCASISTTASVSITAQPTASISYSGTPFCTNGTTGSVTLTGTTGGSYSSTSGLTLDANTGDIDPTTSTPGTYTVTYTIAASTGCGAVTATTSVTVNASPTATISYATPFCTGTTAAQNPTLTGTSGGSYSSTAGLTLDANTGAIIPSSSTPGTYTVTYTVAAAGGCASISTTASVSITAQPTASISYSGTPFCTNGTTGSVTLTGTTGGSYSSTSGLTLDANTGDIDPTTSTPGTYTVTYTIAASAGCGAVTATTSITITAEPTATISYATPFCTGTTAAQNPTLTGTSGGSYSSTAGLTLDANTGAIIPSSSTPGTYTVTYTVAAAGGCASISTTASVTITAQPTASISYSGTPFCTNGTTGSVTLTGTTGGSYSSTSGLTLDANTGDIDPTTSTPGTYTVTYTIAASAGCGAVTATTSVTVNTAPIATISYATPFCTGTTAAQNPTLTGTSGGSYSSTAGLTLDANTGAIIPSSSTPGTYTVTYTVAAAGGCASINTTASVTITAQPTASINYSGTPFCTNGTTGSVTLTGTTGGSYSSTSGLSLDANTGDINPTTSTPGTYTVTYTIAASTGCGAVTATTSVTVNTAPTATISYATPFCTGTTAAQNPTLTGTSGGSYSSTAGLTLDANTGAIIPSSSTPGTYTVTYTVAAAGGCASISTTASVTITAQPTASISYSGTPFCTNGTTGSVTLTGTTGGSYSSTSGLTLDANTGDINPTTSTPGTYTVTYTIAASAGCGAVTATTSVTVNAAPTATISYATPFCTGTTAAQNPTLTGTSGGSYSSTAGLTLDANTGAIIPSSSTPGTYTVTYTVAAAGGCASISTTASVTITAQPTASISYSGTPFCTNGTTGSVTLTGTTGGSYSSTSGLSLDANTGDINPTTSTPGTYTVTYTIAASAGCGAVTATTSVTVNAAPTATISYNGPYCTSELIGQNPLITGNAGGTFASVPTGLSINGTTGTINPSTSIAGTYTITYTVPAVSGCSSVSANATVVINALPLVSFTGLASSYCQGATISSLVGTPSGGSFAGLGVVGNNFDPSLTTAGQVSVTYTFTDVNGCTASSVQQTTINANPVVSFASLNPLCVNDQALVLSGGLPTGGVYSGPGVTAGTFDPSVAGSGVHTLVYTFTDANGCSGIANQTITVNALPVVELQGLDLAYCLNAAPDSIFGFPSGGGTFSGTGVVGGSFDPFVAGVGQHTITYTYTDANGCRNTDSKVTTVNGLPSVSFTGLPPFVCEGSSSLTLTGNPSGGTFVGPGISGNQFDPSQLANGNQTVIYNFTDNLGCAGADTQVVFINSLPVVTLTGLDPTYCTSSFSDVLVGTPSGGTLLGSGITGNTFDPSTANLGLNSISYTFTDNNGCSNTATLTTQVSAVPSISITTPNNNTSICNGSDILLTASPGFVSYTWSDANGTIGTSQTAIVNQAGDYQVTGITSFGCTSSPDSITISILPSPSPNLGNDTTLCSQGTLNLNAGAGFTSYAWSTGATTPTITANGPGTYTVIVTDQNGCEGSDQIVIGQASSINATIVPDGPTTFCEGDSVQLATSQTFVSYLWSNGQTGATIPVTTSGIYSVTVLTADGCVGTSADVSVSVNPAPNPAITSNGPSTLCNGGIVSLTASNGFGSYSWNNNQTGQSIVVNQPGDYIVTVTGSNGCVGSSVPFTVVVNPPLSPVITASGPTDFCFGESVTLTVSIQGNLGLAFWNVSPNPSGSQITVFESGQYSCIVIDANGCIDSSLVNFPTNVTVYNPQPQISFQNNLLIATSGFTSYQWYSNGNVIPGATFSTYDAPVSGTYSVTVTDVNGCTGSSAPIEFTHVGIEAPDGVEIGLQILPNPTEGVFEISAQLPQASKMKIEIFDVLGKLVIQPKDEVIIGEFNRSYNLNHLGNGVYLIKVHVDERSFVRRLVKN